MFRNLIEMPKNSLKKESEKLKFLELLHFFFNQKLFIALVSQINFCKNYIPMYILKWSISTRSFKN